MSQQDKCSQVKLGCCATYVQLQFIMVPRKLRQYVDNADAAGNDQEFMSDKQ